MMAFDHVFMEVARSESRAIQAADRTGALATFLFREFYCTDPGCDCRRVVLHVYWVEQKRVAASINYAFEPPRRRDEPQMYLDPLNAQSEISAELFGLFCEMIAKDREYRERLIAHYTMWKKVVDDPTHRDHAKVRGAAHGDPSFRPAFPRRDGRRSGRRARVNGVPAKHDPAAGNGARARSDAGAGKMASAGAGANRAPAADNAVARDGASGGSRSLELLAAKAARGDGKLQQRFRRLLQKVDELKRRVGAWRAARADIDTAISLHAAAVGRLHRLGRELVELLDRSYAHPVFSKADRKKLGALICHIAGDLIASGDHADLKAVYNRYSKGDFDAEAAMVDAESAEVLRSMMEACGMEFGDADVGSLDKLQAFTEAQLRTLEEDVASEEERRARSKKSAKQLAAEARREAERRSTGKALQEVYRGLAMALHPDREQDPEERARKTEMMREVNVAYEAKDLLRLLELQLALEGVEPARADAVAEEQLRRYNRILDDQAKQLAIELDELELPFRLQMGPAASARLTPAGVIARIGADTEEVKQQTGSLSHDLDAFADVARLKAWLKMQGPRRARPETELSLFG